MFYSKRKILLILCVLSIVAGIIFIKYAGLKTINVESTSLDQGVRTEAFLIFDEELVYINNSNSLEYAIQEGTKVSLNTVIGTTRSLNFNNQDALNLEIIDWKLENGMVQHNNSFQKDLEKIQNEISKIEEELSNIKDIKQVEQLKGKKNQLEHKRSIIEGSFRFAFADEHTLKKIKKELNSKEGHLNGQITLNKLGIDKPGIVFFKKDGLENVLHKDLLGNITPTYFEEIERHISSKEKTDIHHQHQNLKIIDDNNIYLIAKVPRESFSDEEIRLRSVLKGIGTTWDNEYENFISYIENRKDILVLFPAIQMEYQDFLIDGFIVDIKNEPKADEKILTIKIDSNTHRLAEKRILEEVYLLDNRHIGYIIPKRSLIKKDNVYGVIMLGKANEEIFVEVKISEELEEYIILKPEENMDIKSGSKILAKP